MRNQLSLALCLACGVVQAEDQWTPLTGAEIIQSLNDRRVMYDHAWQEFRASGRSLYNAGSDSWGYWSVRGAQYCSMWPPSDVWTCYDMARSGDKLFFIDASGGITEGRYADQD